MAELDKICVRHFEEIGIELLYSNLPIEMLDFHIQNNDSEQEANWQKNWACHCIVSMLEIPIDKTDERNRRCSHLVSNNLSYKAISTRTLNLHSKTMYTY